MKHLIPMAILLVSALPNGQPKLKIPSKLFTNFKAETPLQKST
ncbi:hypothetical protein [Confluentibacter lentus]|nr:hypothetical protein [Confluentibacter lentus]